MKLQSEKKFLGLSLVTAMLLGTSAYAGKIITDAGDPADAGNIRVDNQQYGFGGWNFDNVNVRIVDVNDFTGDIGEFNTTTGEYIGLVPETSFESDIKNTAGTVVGHLHGKDYPVGEPAGIKVINDDMDVKHGKPFNCIMTSSYQAGGYLDDVTPQPVICSSPFQTHKRYKINMLPSSVEGVAPGAYGKSIDLVFNLDDTDTNTTVRRYQVLQKANNYTGVRLDGYKVEVLAGVGAAAVPNAALTLSLGLGEDNNTDIWNVEDMANMSHGLWGPIDDNFEAPGFFDSTRAYYPVVLSDTNQTISHTGDMDGGNYQAIFGNWLPDIWEPQGVFHDHDADPETDGVLLAFFGKAPDTTEDAWYKNSVIVDKSDPKNFVYDYTWALATADDFAAWSGDLYSVGGIEDVLNLGLNYIINVGENAAIGSTFTLRITPHVAADQTAPSYVGADDSIPTPPPADETAPVITLTGDNPMTVLQGRTFTDPGATATDAVDGTVTVTVSGTVDTSTVGIYTLTYTATDVAGNTATETRTVNVVAISLEPVTSSGGGCTYNPNSNGFDMTLLFMMALGALYPFRRRFLK